MKILISRNFERQIYFFEKRRISNILQKHNGLILIFTIGKVGSSSVYISLKENKFINIPIFHLHSLNPERLEEQKKYYGQSKRNSIPFHLIQGEIISQLLPSFGGKIHLFTLLREPITREISSLFQDSFNFFDTQELGDGRMKEVVKNKLQSLRRELPEDEWFRSELKTVFGFDITSFDFNPEIGWQIKEKKDTKIAIMRLENLDDCFNDVCKLMFDSDCDYQLLSKNKAVNKFYYEAYKTIKHQTGYTKSEMNQVFDSRFIQKFYPDFTEVIRKRWQKEI